MSAPIIYVCVAYREADFIVECEIHDNGPLTPPELIGKRFRIDSRGTAWEPYDETCYLDDCADDALDGIASLIDEDRTWPEAFALYVKKHGVDK